MTHSKLEVAAAGLLLAAAVGITAGFFIHVRERLAGMRAEDSGEPDARPAAPGPPGVSYSPTTVVSEDVPIPDEFSMSVLRQAAVFPSTYGKPGAERPDAELDIYRALPDGAVVVTDPPRENLALAAAFTEAHARGEKGELQAGPGCGLSILTTGPLLLPIDRIEVSRLVCHGKRLELEVVYTPYPRDATQPPKWKDRKPILLVPLVLAAGSYQLEVTWQAVEKIPGGEPLPGKSSVQTCTFAVSQGVAASQAVRTEGVDFQTLVDGQCPVPAADDRRRLHMGLRVTNRGDKDLFFEPRGMQLLSDSLKASSGGLFRYGGGCYSEAIAKPVRVPAGQSHVFIVCGELGWWWQAGSEALQLSGVIGAGKTHWRYDGLSAGKYSLCFDYTVSEPSTPQGHFWTGRVRSNRVEFALVPK